MLLITNRVLHTDRSGLDVFGKEPNPSGPNELRLVEVNNKGSKVRPLDENVGEEELMELEKKYGFEIDHNTEWFVSLRVACCLFDQARSEKRSLLFYVHGYNNDMADVLRTANEIQKLYGVIVVPFSWPANGGGKISGTAAYLSDKDDARASATALHRVVEKVQFYHQLLTEGTQNRIMRQAKENNPSNHEAAYGDFTDGMERECAVSINLLCHSMGNYVLKHATLPSESSLRHLTFDNVVLVAADVNNPGHAEWLDNIPVRNRIYVVINEKDRALKWSRVKPGREQKARLGHHLRSLDSKGAHYVDVTETLGVGSDHGYFLGEPVRANNDLQKAFGLMFTGGVAESQMSYHADANVYRLR